MKNKIVANGNAKANLTYVDAIVETCLFRFFWIEDLRFWKNAAKIVTIIQFINNIHIVFNSKVDLNRDIKQFNKRDKYENF